MMIINLMGLLLIALIVWWFWLYKPAEAEVEEKEK
jgi:plastocyanin domain-containing protein